jgi:hypothetical protein
MKWMVSGIAVLVITAGILALPGRTEWQCLQCLAVFDHHINCAGHVAMVGQDGIVSNKVWQRKYILDMTPEKYLRCPTTGTNYVLTFTVGEHPYCPIHGHLIEKYNVRPHHTSKIDIVRGLVPFICIFIASLLAVIVGIVAIVRRIRMRKGKAQPATPPYSEPTVRPPQG